MPQVGFLYCDLLFLSFSENSKISD